MDTPSSSSSQSKKCPSKFQNVYEDFSRVTAQAVVFSFYIDKFDADGYDRRGDLYGTIEAIDLDGTIELYHRTRQNSEDVRANRPISLTGPRSISVLVGFAVNIDLHLRKDEDGIMDGNDSKDVEVGKWQFSWDVGRPDDAYITKGRFLQEISNRIDELSMEKVCKMEKAGYNRALKAVFGGQDGCCAVMYYTILPFAVQAWVVVHIVHLSCDSNSPPIEYDVHGSLVASYGNFKYDSDHGNIEEYCKITLLNTGELGSVKGIRGKRLELTRSVMAVPAYSSLVIEADLWYKGINCRPKIAKGSTGLAAMSFGHSGDYITGDNDIAIKVVVGWSFNSRVRHGDPPI